MIDKLLQKHFNRKLDDIDYRRVRVWNKIYAQISSELTTERREFPAFRYWGLAPLFVTLLLVVMGTGALSVFGRSLPGDAFYGVKRAVEEAQLKVATDPETKSRLQMGLIEKRVHEISELENRSAGQEKIDGAKAEVGQKVIALVKESAASISVGHDKELETVASKSDLATVSTADAKVVGEAVTVFLKSTVLTGKAREEKLKEIVTAVLADNEAKTAPKEREAVKPATKPAETKPESKIVEEEVESPDVEIK